MYASVKKKGQKYPDHPEDNKLHIAFINSAIPSLKSLYLFTTISPVAIEYVKSVLCLCK